MKVKRGIIQFERFTEQKHLKWDAFLPIVFCSSFLAVGLFEKNLILPQNGKGLLQHENIWMFLTLNFLLPILISKFIKKAECDIDKSTYIDLKKKFTDISHRNFTIFLFNLFRVIGFIIFIFNSLQNANLINKLPFDFWDSINYPLCYVVSRVHKFYFFSHFIPTMLLYAYILIVSLSKLIESSGDKFISYPIKNYVELNVLCNLGLDILLTIVISFTAFCLIVYSIHNRFDITTITTIIISVGCSGITILMYMLLAKNYYVRISNYVKKNIKKIDTQLSEIHQYVLKTQVSQVCDSQLDTCLKREGYLSLVKEKLEKQSKIPCTVKAIVTALIPIIPSIIKVFNPL